MSTKRTRFVVETKGIKKAEGQYHSLGKSIGSTALKYVSLTTAAFAAFRLIGTAVEKYKIQELAEKRLEVAIGRRSEALLKQASALQKSTSFADEEIIQAQSLIGSFVKEEDAIQKATAATLDLAAAKGMDLTAAADLVAKTLGSTTNALSRYGIQVTGAVGSTERLNSLTKNIASVFGGQAAAAMDTMSGRAENLSNSWGDLLEKGGKLIDIIERNTGGYNKLARDIDITAERVDNFGKALQRLFGDFGTPQISAQEQAVQRLKDVLATLTDEQKKQVMEQGRILSGKLKLALALQKENEEYQSLNEKYKEWVSAYTEKQAKDQQELDFWLRYNMEIGTFKANIIDISNIQRQASEKQIDQIEKVKETQSDAAADFEEKASQIITRNQFLFDNFSGAMVNALSQSKITFEGIGQAFADMLKRMAIELIAQQIILAFFDAVGLGPAARGISTLTNTLGITGNTAPSIGGPSNVVNQSSNTVNLNINGTVDRRTVQQIIIPEINRSLRQGIV